MPVPGSGPRFTPSGAEDKPIEGTPGRHPRGSGGSTGSGGSGGGSRPPIGGPRGGSTGGGLTGGSSGEGGATDGGGSTGGSSSGGGSTGGSTGEGTTDSPPSAPTIADVIKTIATTPELAAAATRLFEAKDSAYLIALATGDAAGLMAIVQAEAARGSSSKPPAEKKDEDKDLPATKDDGTVDKEKESEEGEPSFYEKYKTPIWILGGAAGLYVVGRFAKQKGWI